MKCDIIIPVWNQLACTRDCIESIQRNTDVPYQLILIDNASNDDTRSYLCGLKDANKNITLIRNEENIGFIKAVNQGLERSDSPYVCIMNNDTVAADGWLTKMIDLAESRPDIGLVNPRSESSGRLTLDEYARLLAKKKGDYVETNQCLGFCMLVKREVIERIGYLDEAYGVGGFDDTEFSMKAHKAGYKCVSASDAYVFHNWHTSFKEAGNREDLVQRNERIFFSRYGRYLRIAYPMFCGPQENLISDVYTSLGLAREWNWVHAWLGADRSSKRRLDLLCLPRHQSLRLFHLSKNRFIFYAVVLLKLIERAFFKRKKHFDAVLVSDPGILSVLARFKKLFRTPLIYIGKEESPIDLKNEDSWSKRAHTIVAKIKKEIT